MASEKIQTSSKIVSIWRKKKELVLTDAKKIWVKCHQYVFFSFIPPKYMITIITHPKVETEQQPQI